MSLFSKLREQSGTEFDYRVDVPVDLYFDTPKDVTVGTVAIPFDIDMEHRSWGVKDLLPILSTVVMVPYVEVMEDGTQVDKELSVDLSTAVIEWVSGASFTAIGLTVEVTDAGQVKKATVEFSYFNPNR